MVVSTSTVEIGGSTSAQPRHNGRLVQATDREHERATRHSLMAAPRRRRPKGEWMVDDVPKLLLANCHEMPVMGRLGIKGGEKLARMYASVSGHGVSRLPLQIAVRFVSRERGRSQEIGSHKICSLSPSFLFFSRHGSSSSVVQWVGRNARRFVQIQVTDLQCSRFREVGCIPIGLRAPTPETTTARIPFFFFFFFNYCCWHAPREYLECVAPALEQEAAALTMLFPKICIHPESAAQPADTGAFGQALVTDSRLHTTCSTYV